MVRLQARIPRWGLGARGCLGQHLSHFQGCCFSTKWKVPVETSGQRHRVGSPPSATSCPHYMRALLQLSADHVCGAQARVEFPVPSWLACSLAKGGAGHCVGEHRQRLMAARLHPECAAGFCLHRGILVCTLGEITPQVFPCLPSIHRPPLYHLLP